MRGHQLNKTIISIQWVTDVIVSIAAWELSYFFRFYVIGDPQPGSFENFLYYSMVIAALVVMFSIQNHLYDPNRYFTWQREFLLTIKSQLQAVFTFVILLYFTWPNRISRLTLGLYIGFGVSFALLMRAVVRRILIQARVRGRNLRHVLVVGRGTSLRDYIDMMLDNPQYGVGFIGWVGSEGEADKLGIRSLTMEEVELDGSNTPDAVVIGYNAENHGDLVNTLAVFNRTIIRTLVIPDLEDAFIGYTISDFHGVPMISINTARINMFQESIKRIVDIVGSSLGIIILSPLLCLLGLLIKLTSRGSVFYGQERMTQDGRVFIMWKFRTMREDAESQGAQWTSENDSRRTAAGVFLRRTSMDELAQLWNVLKGDMSLVGPRPERPVFIEKFKYSIPSYMLRHRMKSGITGWAQINGWRGDTDLAKRIEFDIFYIRNWSLLFDFKILILTMIRGFVHNNAY